MKSPESKTASVACSQKANQSFFSKKAERLFFGDSRVGEFTFFKPAVGFGVAGGDMIQRKCAECERNETSIQRQEQPEPPETKPVSPENTQPAAPIPLGRKPRAANCSSDPKFPNLGCYGQQLKLDIDENLFNNAHQFNRVATLFPGDNQLMLDTFLRYGIGKNLLETSFGFAGANKKWSSILSYGTGAALKTYELLQNGKLKLDVQLPLGKGVNLDIKFDYNANPGKPGEEKGINTVIGVSGSF